MYMYYSKQVIFFLRFSHAEHDKHNKLLIVRIRILIKTAIDNNFIIFVGSWFILILIKNDFFFILNPRIKVYISKNKKQRNKEWRQIGKDSIH